MPDKMAMMAITTSSSIKVKPRHDGPFVFMAAQIGVPDQSSHSLHLHGSEITERVRCVNAFHRPDEASLVSQILQAAAASRRTIPGPLPLTSTCVRITSGSSGASDSNWSIFGTADRADEPRW